LNSPASIRLPISDSASGLLRDFELNRSTRLLPDYRRLIANPPARAHVVDFEPNEVAAAELAIDGQIHGSRRRGRDIEQGMPDRSKAPLGFEQRAA
jgi:hypothetical protein